MKESSEDWCLLNAICAALSQIHPAMWFAIAGAIALVNWWMNAKVEQRVVVDYRKGKKL